MTTQTFSFGRETPGLFHDSHCSIAVGTGSWQWFLDLQVTCLLCLSGQHRVQTWHKKPYVWMVRALPATECTCLPGRQIKEAFALNRQDFWLPWNGKSRAFAFSGKAVEGYPIAVYPRTTGRRGSEVSRVATDFTCSMHGVSNGHEATPTIRTTYGKARKAVFR